MRIKSIIITIILLTASIAFAADKLQNLVCEPVETPPVSVEVETRHGDNTVYIVVPYGNFDENGNSILFRLEGYEPGAYFFRARFIDASGWKGEWGEELKAVKPGKTGKVLVR